MYWMGIKFELKILSSEAVLQMGRAAETSPQSSPRDIFIALSYSELSLFCVAICQRSKGDGSLLSQASLQTQHFHYFLLHLSYKGCLSLAMPRSSLTYTQVYCLQHTKCWDHSSERSC